MRPRPNLLLTLPSRGILPLGQRPCLRVQRLPVEFDAIKALHELDEEERHLVIRELLAEADARAGVEGEEDEWVWSEVGLYAVIEESVGVEFFGCGGRGGRMGYMIRYGVLLMNFATYHLVPSNPCGGACGKQSK